MKTTLKTKFGSVIVSPMPYSKAVFVAFINIDDRASGFEIPADMAGVFAQAVEVAAAASAERPTVSHGVAA